MDFKKITGEQVMWQGRPEFKPYLFSGLLEFLGTIGFFVFTWSLFIVLSIVGKSELNWSLMYLIAFTILGSGLFRLFKKLIIYKKIAYFITNLRVIIKKGNTENRITSLSKNRITLLDLKVSKTEQRFRVGTVLIHFGEVKDNDEQDEKVFYKLEAIKEPNEILKLF